QSANAKGLSTNSVASLQEVSLGKNDLDPQALALTVARKKLLQLESGRGASNQIALNLLAATAGEHGALSLGFYAFCYQPQFQAASESDDRSSDGGIIQIGCHIAHE